MRGLTRLFLLSSALLFSITANAAFIDGSTMTLTGDYTTAPANAGDLTTVTAITLDTVGTSGAATDTFAETIGWGTIDEVGPYTEANLIGFSEINNFFTFAGWQLDLKSLVVAADTTAGFLHLYGTGRVSGNGHQSSAAEWSFSAHDATDYTMTVTTVVPVPAAVWLFGSGLIGLVGIARRKT